MSIFIVKASKIVTVSNTGTIVDGAMLIQDGKIADLGLAEEIKVKYGDSIPSVDYQDSVITPGLIDCHTHLLEFAPSSHYPITKETQILAAKAILLKSLASGITALGEQICGSPMLSCEISTLKQSIRDFPIDFSFATTSISIGLETLLHFTSVTGSLAVAREQLVDPEIVKEIANHSEFGGENVFINATPANFTKDLVPNAGEIIYSQEELNRIVSIFHSMNKKIGTHVAGKEGIDMALNAQFDVLHHAHGITKEQMERVSTQGVKIVATPLGGTHLPPNTIDEVIYMIHLGIPVAISSDGYLPPHENTVSFPKVLEGLIGPDSLMAIAHPYMKQLIACGYNENNTLSLITSTPAKILEKDHLFGSLEIGKDANFLVAEGVPGLEIVDIEKIKAVYFRGEKMIQRS
ncbi:amidohydrolase family protein [Ureibacillus sp. MALMAid1270]|uniref:amidohydrolase family protein n=1 Tax=Ureibacillus sp. MALMAid1270 TaxID=3411629 RepID=UPI003BA7556E